MSVIVEGEGRLKTWMMTRDVDDDSTQDVDDDDSIQDVDVMKDYGRQGDSRRASSDMHHQTCIIRRASSSDTMAVRENFRMSAKVTESSANRAPSSDTLT